MTGLTEEQLADHKSGIGSSDAATIFGVNPWQTAFQLWQRKTDKVPDLEENERMFWGTELEAPVASAWSRRTGIKIRRHRKAYRHKEHPFILCHVDRLIEGGVLEVKTAGAYSIRYWADGEIPDMYMIQVQHQLMCTGREHGRLVVLLGGQEMRDYEIVANPALQRAMLEEDLKFWECVTNDSPPPARTAADIEAMYPKGGGGIMADDVIAEQVEAYRQAHAAEREGAAAKREAADKIKLFMGESDTLRWYEDGSTMATWRAPKDKTVVDWEAVARQCGAPVELVDQHTEVKGGARRLLVK